MHFEIELDDQKTGFASAHFIVGHDKCGRLHGHNYFVKVSLEGELNEEHMILDYGLLKEQLRKLTKPLDHKVLIPSKTEKLAIEEDEQFVTIRILEKRYVIPKEDVIFLPLQATTAEELARYFQQALKKIWPKFRIKVTVEESPGASATYSEE